MNMLCRMLLNYKYIIQYYSSSIIVSLKKWRLRSYNSLSLCLSGVEAVLRSFTEVKVELPQCQAQLQAVYLSYAYVIWIKCNIYI